MDLCPSHGTQLLEFGSEGRYLCPVCLQHQWQYAHDSEEWGELAFFPKLYGRGHRVVKRTPEDLRPATVWTYKRLRTRVRAYAVAILHIPGAGQMDLEPLLPFVGPTWTAVLFRLHAFEARGTRKSRATR